MDLENTENFENSAEEEMKAKGDKKAHFNKEVNEKDGRKKFFKKKVCYFCKNNIDVLDYKDIKLFSTCKL